MKSKGIRVKKVAPDYKMSDKDAELIAKLTDQGVTIILDRRVVKGGA